ncbi:hypothetical protein KSB_67500 [Ktedonobacter robiniae]|uniref:Uncharacterized protein n=1 Tax=Ktedonobacter robiniae TaxID=2778365 RepID=A0ABQ3V014_9CHLR|nr:hypothetical protein KSB_67500 [Ktedonobacter robiniae]
MFHPYSCERQTAKRTEEKRVLAYYIAGEKKYFHGTLGKGAGSQESPIDTQYSAWYRHTLKMVNKCIFLYDKMHL